MINILALSTGHSVSVCLCGSKYNRPFCPDSLGSQSVRVFNPLSAQIPFILGHHTCGFSFSDNTHTLPQLAPDSQWDNVLARPSERSTNLAEISEQKQFNTKPIWGSSFVPKNKNKNNFQASCRPLGTEWCASFRCNTTLSDNCCQNRNSFWKVVGSQKVLYWESYSAFNNQSVSFLYYFLSVSAIVRLEHYFIHNVKL